MNTSKCKLFLLSLVWLFAMGLNTAFAQKSIELKYKLKPGQQFTQVTNIEQTIQFDAMGQKATLDQEMVFYTSNTIDSVNANLISQNSVFNRIVMDQQIFGMTIKYDSDDSTTFNSPMGPEFAEQMNQLIGAKVVSTITDRGQLQHLDASALGVAGEMSSSLNTGNNYATYPDHKIKVGDSWEETLNAVESSKMAVTIKYTLTKASKKQAVLSLEGVISANELNPETGGELNGTMKGEMTVDRKTGMVITSSLQMDMTMEMEQNGMKFPATVNSFVDTTIKEEK